MILMYCFNLESNNILDIQVCLLHGADTCQEMNDYIGTNIPEHQFFEVSKRNGKTLCSVELEPDEMAKVESTLLRDAIFDHDWDWEDLGMVLHVLAERGKRKWTT